MAWRDRAPWSRLGLAAALTAALASSGCAWWRDVPAYYWQSAAGHLSVMRQAQPIDALLADPATDARLREKLALVVEIRRFASASLGLPDNGSYLRYADLKRPFVIWNVFATPPLSLKLQQWCFPVAGCVSYRGYYDREQADAYAQRLRDEGLEAYVGGVPAYSTLGWFDDPVLNTFIGQPEGELARLVFHELAHQQLYVKNDSMFNESFATTVEQIGVERWLAAREAQGHGSAAREAWQRHAPRRTQFIALLKRHREALQAVYESPLSDAEKLAAKTATFEALRRDYAQLRAEWGGYAGYDRWFAQPLTNAHLASVSTYTELVPAFRALLAAQGGDLPRFYAQAAHIGALPRPEREAALAALAGGPSVAHRAGD
ncbi:MAG: aminopeptidase [Burkholderiales bacterium]|nr:aminopeptidase [Burkholderiales bacterium]